MCCSAGGGWGADSGDVISRSYQTSSPAGSNGAAAGSNGAGAGGGAGGGGGSGSGSGSGGYFAQFKDGGYRLKGKPNTAAATTASPAPTASTASTASTAPAAASLNKLVTSAVTNGPTGSGSGSGSGAAAGAADRKLPPERKLPAAAYASGTGSGASDAAGSGSGSGGAVVVKRSGNFEYTYQKVGDKQKLLKRKTVNPTSTFTAFSGQGNKLK